MNGWASSYCSYPSALKGTTPFGSPVIGGRKSYLMGGVSVRFGKQVLFITLSCYAPAPLPYGSSNLRFVFPPDGYVMCNISDAKMTHNYIS